MEAGIASTLLFIYPILVALIMTLCFKEKTILSDYLMHSAGSYRHRTALQRRKWYNPQFNRCQSGDGFFTFVRHLYCKRKPPKIERYCYAQAHILCFAFRLIFIFRPGGLRSKSSLGRDMVSLGQSACFSHLPDSYFFSLYDTVHSIYRFHSHSYSRRFRTFDGSILRSNDFRRITNFQVTMRNIDDYNSGYAYYSRK